MVCAFKEQEDSIRAVRSEVFLIEQKVPRKLEIDGADSDCVHAVVWLDEVPVGTGRITTDGKVERVAVLKSFRGRGVGRMIMADLEAVALRGGLAETRCHAQVSAQVFYERIGYEVAGASFIEAGILHVPMKKILGGGASTRS